MVRSRNYDAVGGRVKNLMFSFFAHKSTGPGTTEMRMVKMVMMMVKMVMMIVTMAMMMVKMVMIIVMVVRSAGRVGGGW